MKILISNMSNDPIYNQIANQIRGNIVRGELDEAESLPSIRGLARDLQISVITTKRAYDELEKEGFIQTVPGKGSYVAIQNRELMKEKKLKIIEDKLSEIVQESRLMGIDYKELDEILKILYGEAE